MKNSLWLFLQPLFKPNESIKTQNIMEKKLDKIFKSNRPIAVVTTTTDWNELPRFRHQVTRQLTRWYNVLYIYRGFNDNDSYTYKEFEKISDELVIFTPEDRRKTPRRIYWNIPPLHDAVDSLSSKKILCLLKTTNRKLTLINFQFDFHKIYDCDIFDKKIYICNDDFPNSVKRKFQTKIMQHYENKVIRSSDLCVVHSNTLLKKFKESHKNVALLMPGHEFEIDYSNIKINKDSRKIAIAYMGYIDDRLNLDWMQSLSSESNLEIHLIGPVSDTFKDKNLINKKPFILHGSHEGEKLKKLLLEMDVCIIPFNTEHPVVKACTPNKIYQYIACGKPVITSDINLSTDFPEYVIRKSNTYEEFLKNIIQSFKSNNESYVISRLDLAKDNSWNERGNVLKTLIDEIKDKK